METYYHVIIESIDSKEAEVILRDENRKNLSKDFVRPYLRGQDLFFKNRIYRIKTIEAVKIIETDSPLEIILDEALKKDNESIEKSNRDSSIVFMPRIGWDEYEIAQHGKDVTREFINTAPLQTLFYRFFYNRWVITIGSILLGAVVAWLFS